MRYQRTQVYLDPEQHAALIAEAAARGISLAELMRRIVDAHVSEQAPRYDAKTWDALIGVAGESDDEPTDVVSDWKGEVAKAFAAGHARETAPPARKRAAKR